MSMGSHHQIKRRVSRCSRLKSIPTQPTGRSSSSRVCEKQTRERLYMGIQITICLTLLLHMKEGQQIMTRTGLSQNQHPHYA